MRKHSSEQAGQKPVPIPEKLKILSVETAQPAKCLPHKQEEVLQPQNLHRKWTQWWRPVLAISTQGALKWVDPWGSMATSFTELVNSKPMRDRFSKKYGGHIHEE